MLSKLVADREQSARSVGAAFQTYGPLAAAQVADLLREELLEEESLPDVRLFVALLQRRQQRTCQAMTAADQAHVLELGDDAPVRAARDTAKTAVLAIVASIRLSLTSRFGQDFGGRLGASGSAPASPSEILSWGRNVHAALKRLELPAADPNSDDNDEVATFQKEAAVRKLGQRLTQLQDALGDVALEGREAEATQVNKDKAVAAYDQTFSLSAGLLEVLLRFAGEGVLADQVRPSTRRPGTTAQASGTPDDPTS